MENFIKKYNVSRETYQNLETMVNLLHQWQDKFNLVSRNSLPEVWTRHIADSAGLFKYLPPEVDSVYDFGSGAGFPGLVLAVMAKEIYPSMHFVLIESIAKKTLYLNAVKELTGANVEIINNRIENIKAEKADVITSRAMCALPELLKYSRPFCGKDTKLIFLKGRSYEQEVASAKKDWKFNLEIIQNQESEDGVILVITDLHHKGEKNA